MINGDHPAFELIDNIDIVRGQQHRGAVFVNFFQQAHNIPAMLWVKVTSRLVSDQDLWLPNHCPGNRHPLALTARQLVWEILFLTFCLPLFFFFPLLMFSLIIS